MPFLYLKGKNTYKYPCANVILSTDSNPNYYFYAPIVTRLWRDLDFNPVVVIVGDLNWFEIKQKVLVLNSILNNGGSVVFINTNDLKSFNGYNHSMLAQISRLCAPFFMSPPDYCITSDIDMIVLDYSWISSYSRTKDITIYFSNAYDYKRFAMCHVGMSSFRWADVMGFNDCVDIFDGFNAILKGLPRNTSKENQWGWDEEFLFTKLNKKLKYCCMIERPTYPNPKYVHDSRGIPSILPKYRLDRSNWCDMEKIIDIHCRRKGHSSRVFQELVDVLKGRVSNDSLNFINNYYKSFMESV